MNLRSARKNYVFDLSPELVFEILKYINPLLHYLVSRHYFHDNVFNIDLREIASQYGQLEILKWFYPRINRNGAGRKIEYEIFRASILGNQMHILEWIYESLDWHQAQQEADQDLSMVKFNQLINFGKKSMLVAKTASKHGNLIMVKFLIDKGFEYRHTDVTQAAAASGNLELLMYLRS